MSIKVFGLILGATFVATNAHATGIAFASVGYQALSGSNVTYSMNGGTLHTGTGTNESAVQVNFSFEDVPGLPPSLPRDVQAFMTWSASRTSGAAGDVNCGAICTQNVSGGTLSIVAANPVATPKGHLSMLLQATFSGVLTGGLSGTGFNLGGDSALGNSVVFQSDFFDFSHADYSAFNFSLNSVLANLTMQGKNFADLFLSGGGVFLANNYVMVAGTPEPSSFVLGLIALAAIAMLHKYRRPRAV